MLGLDPAFDEPIPDGVGDREVAVVGRGGILVFAQRELQVPEEGGLEKLLRLLEAALFFVFNIFGVPMVANLAQKKAYARNITIGPGHIPLLFVREWHCKVQSAPVIVAFLN
jgi:hypothetical protein